VGASFIRLSTILIGTKFLKWTQKIQAKNAKRLVKAVMERPEGESLLTVCNHLSYLDDTAFYNLLPLQSLFSERKVKWSPAAQEICFTNKILSAYFTRCHAVPVTRGQGVYQRGVDFLINKLNEGHWIHIYPEGKMNMTGEDLRLKWGVGRIIAEAKKLPTVLPMWMVEADCVYR
jgi:monolysocardiolipin acyltransferase